MSYDHFAKLAEQQACPQGTGGTATSLVSWIVDGCTSWFSQAELIADERDRNRWKNDARNCYMNRARGMTALALPDELGLDTIQAPGRPSWIGIEVGFKLATPWYSKDDRPFHVLDNPVRKDRVFGVPYMSAASWKGMLRWACRMQAGLLEHLEQGKRFEEWSDPDWVLHLFGNEKGATDDFRRGALAFYPTWFSKLGFEVINPHSRKTRAGTQPIYYEVVPAGTQGTLRLLYAPLPGDERRDALVPLIEAVDALLTTYGFSAKRTVGWGTAIVQRWTARRMDEQPIEASTAADFKAKLKNWFNPGEANDD